MDQERAEARLVRDDVVRLRMAGTSDDWCQAVVAVASTNGRALGLLLDDPLRVPGGIVMGAFPLYIDYATGKVTGLGGEEYEMEVKG